MLAPALRIVNFEAVALHRVGAAADMVELAAGEDVFHQSAELRAALAELLLGGLHRPRDGVMQIDAARFQKGPDVAKIAVAVVEPYMLEHADRRDLVEFDAGQIAEVPQFDRDAVLQTEPLDLFRGEVELRLRQRHAMRAHAVVLCRMADQPAPAAADVEQRFARAEPQLAARHVELRDLGRGEVRFPIPEIGAGIDHLRIEKERVEGVRDVIMKLHLRLVVAALAMLRGLHACIGVPLAAAAGSEDERQERADRKRLVQPLRQPSRGPRSGPRRQIEQRPAFEIDRTLGDQLHHRGQARPAHQARQRPWRRDGERQPVVCLAGIRCAGIGFGRQGKHRPVPQPDREIER